MFIPCDHCLRKHATHVSEVNDRGKREHLRLCKGCYERLQEDLAHRPPFARDPSLTLAQQERAIAEELHANLLPRKVPQIPGYDLSAWSRPSPEVGGDYYDLVEIDDDHLGLLIADVSGRGIPASIVMTETRALMKSELVRSVSPSGTLARVNRELHKDIKRGMFVTMFYAILEIPKARLTCVSAGHHPMLLWRKNAGTLHQINPNGIALGIERGPLFERVLKEQTVELSPGDRFTFHTDGVIDARNENNEEYGRSRFHLKAKELSDLSSADFLQFLIREIDRHCGDAPQHDDIAILTGRYKGDA
jgi:phosphoserine phosphatase RsbU/P